MKATLADGTVIEGTAEEVEELLRRERHPAGVWPVWPSACACPKPDPLNTGASVCWGGYCPLHSLRYV
jgi:hypothetical protein